MPEPFVPTIVRGRFVIKNLTANPYLVAEIGGYELASNATVDLMDETVPKHYNDWTALDWLSKYGTQSNLYQDIQSGKIQVVESVDTRKVRLQT